MFKETKNASARGRRRWERRTAEIHAMARAFAAAGLLLVVVACVRPWGAAASVRRIVEGVHSSMEGDRDEFDERTTAFTLHGAGSGFGRASPAPPHAPDEPWVETVSWRPRAFLVHNLMSDEECEHIIAQARASVEPMRVVFQNGTRTVDDRIRSAWGTYLPRRYDTVVSRIDERIAILTGIPVTNSETMNVLR